MCWIGNNNKSKVLTEDLTVLKVLDKHMLSPTFCQKYEIGKEYTSTIFLRENTTKVSEYLITTGLHSYSSDCQVNLKGEDMEIFPKNGGKRITHHDTRMFSLFEATVPKGSVVFENEKGEIVSDTLIVTKKKLIN